MVRGLLKGGKGTPGFVSYHVCEMLRRQIDRLIVAQQVHRPIAVEASVFDKRLLNFRPFKHGEIGPLFHAGC